MNRFVIEAITAHRAGRLDEAERFYRAALRENPDEGDALALLGTLLASTGRNDEAITHIEAAIGLDPNAALFKFHRGNILMASGDAGRAAGAFLDALAQEPGMVPAYYNRGLALGRLGAWNEAEKCYLQTIALAPDHAEAHNNLALVYEHKDNLPAAIELLQHAVLDKPDYAEAWLNLCKIAEKSGDPALSLRAGQKAVALMPVNASAWLSLGAALNRLDRHEEAEAVYKRAIALKPDWTESWDNLGLTYQFLNRFAEAETAFRKVIELAGETIPDASVREIPEREFGQRHWHLAQLELMCGAYARGFGRYRCRFSARGGLQRMDFTRPVWRGEDISGKTILVFDEKGYGDGLMMCRYLPLLKARGAFVKFHVKPAFGPLFKGWNGADQVTVHGEDFGDFDVYAWMFDLPYAFGTTLETVPAAIPYLPVPAPDTRTHLTPEADNAMRIGVVWAGSADLLYDNRRIPLDALARLVENEGYAFYSLTRDKRPGDDNRLGQLPIIDLAPQMEDFGALARFIMQMDLVISCDTATPQLAGGLGKDVWTLLPFSSDWRWLTGRFDSPWYPTMRLFRQSQSGDWDSVIDEVAAALNEWRMAKISPRQAARG